MALSANTVWEIRPSTGSDTNGGAFVAGSGGTDYSQQASPQLSVSDAACTGNTTVTSVTGGFTAAMVGSIMYLSSGPGWYQITARASSNSITIDRSGPNASGMTANVGGALKTLSKLSALMVGSNKAFCKAEATQQTAATLSFTPGNITPSISAPFTRLIGYTTTRTDGGKFTLQLITNTGLTGILFNSNGMKIENFAIDCNSLGTSMGIDLEGSNNIALNCKVSNFTLRGIYADGNNNLVFGCEVTGGTSAGTAAIDIPATLSSKIKFCNVHDNACPGIVLRTGGTSCTWNLVTNNTGASSDGIMAMGTSGMVIEHNTVYGSGQHGINLTNAQGMNELTVRNNILASSGGYGLANTNGAGTPASPEWDGNAYYNNTSGTRSNMDDTSTVAINGISPYTNVLDILITDGSPFTNAAGGDFTLNNTALRGALIRGHGVPGAIPGVSQVGYTDMGCFEHQDPAGGANRAALPSGLSALG